MGNRVYFYATEFTGIPAQKQCEEFRSCTGTEYEAQGFLPLFWLLAFEETDVKIMEADREGFEDDERPFAYLHCEKYAAIARLKKWVPIVDIAGGKKKQDLLQQWISRIEAEPYTYVLANTEELDWMGKEGALELELKTALRHLDKENERKTLQMSNKVKSLCGLDGCDFDECQPHWLLGGANDGTEWPLPPIPKLESPPSNESSTKGSWWKFW